MIRLANTSDADNLGVLLHKFASDVEGYQEFMGDQDHYHTMASGLLSSPSVFTVLGVSDGKAVGMLIIYTIPPGLFPLATIAQEAAFFIDKDHRGGSLAARMVKAAENHAQALGVTHLLMVCESAMKGDSVERFYKRRGYRELERLFLKEM